LHFGLTVEQEEIRQAVLGLCSRFPASHWLKKDKEGGLPQDFCEAVASGGWLGVAVAAMGDYGYAKVFHIERLLREAFIRRIAPTTPHLVPSYVAEKKLGLPKSY
jgi:alkylation response protein AidB-like acyl-CoA dehydrogenase